jgi:hypothetical protein
MHFIAGIPGSTQRLASCGLKHHTVTKTNGSLREPPYEMEQSPRKLPQEMEAPMTYQERYEKTNAWSARRIAKELILMNGKNEIVSENDEQRICDAERQDTATRQLVKPQVKPSLLA